MRQNISPIGAGLVLLVVLVVVGILWYQLSEPPMVNVPKKSEEQMLKEGQQMMQGFKAGIVALGQQTKAKETKEAEAQKARAAKKEQAKSGSLIQGK